MKKNVRIILSIYGFEKDPLELAKSLGIDFERHSTKGVVSAGRHMPSKENNLQLDSKRAESDDLDLHINSLLDRLPSGLNNVREASIIIIAAIYIKEGDSTPLCAMFIRKETLKRLADLDVELDFDIYG